VGKRQVIRTIRKWLGDYEVTIITNVKNAVFGLEEAEIREIVKKI
jgi:hypothetical protein